GWSLCCPTRWPQIDSGEITRVISPAAATVVHETFSQRSSYYKKTSSSRKTNANKSSLLLCQLESYIFLAVLARNYYLIQRKVSSNAHLIRQILIAFL